MASVPRNLLPIKSGARSTATCERRTRRWWLRPTSSELDLPPDQIANLNLASHPTNHQLTRTNPPCKTHELDFPLAYLTYLSASLRCHFEIGGNSAFKSERRTQASGFLQAWPRAGDTTGINFRSIVQCIEECSLTTAAGPLSSASDIARAKL